ncbi:hemerythrin domain-containing protein [Cupriavidus sp.]|uniref:hemerythrin domain-containing protein n=1 Tax=Cupriavidus sp. TaxID=1873897 RepID=UPI0025BB9E93|nr:hemerythrin domain-containing protein [Cupriavidus sp.]MCA3186253.1 hemerythrin domain-containing protein [Cupriavidus sp.]MCA3191202.1 hemerythrin domain-containing protein [Cupriavidus sp.]MCA3200266.1 hemerythrin domain-containing protein [Cupriavidus sp.]MCA3205467.1 hemerythrin domain-containing protein [Cupriavidus sp.]MCA3206677.1 hemerythrin domain-containing protein [Cupriavidus sp.]
MWARQGAPGWDPVLDEAKDEHAEAKQIIARIQANPAEGLESNFKALVAGVRHHVKEEEDEMFPMVVANAVPLDDVARQLSTRKSQLKTGAQ